MTVTFMAMLRGFRKPDGLLCHYPVFSIDENRFFPSHLMAVDEEFFSACFLKFAMACFNRRRAEQTNPLMSPIHAPPEMLKELPPCKFMIAQIDALRDQAIHMAVKILKNGGEAEITLMEDFIHGFCSMDLSHFGISECSRGTEMTASLFRKIFLQIEQRLYLSIQRNKFMPPQRFSDNEFNFSDREDRGSKPMASTASREAEQRKVEEAKEAIRRTIATRVFHHDYEESKE